MEDAQTKLDEMQMEIDGEVYTVSNIREVGFGDILLVETDEGLEFHVSKDSETAGEAAKEYWEDVAENDPRELTCIVGEETLMGWALNQPSGHTGCSNLKEWLDLTATVPEEQWAGYDTMERSIERMHPDLKHEFEDSYGFVPTVAYRHN